MRGPTRSLEVVAEPAAARGTLSLRAGLRWPFALVAAAAALLLALAISQGLGAGRGAPVAHRSHASVASHKELSSLPLPAQAPISAALGRDDRAYHVSGSGASLRAANPSQRLDLHFGQGSVAVSSGAARVGLALSAVGAGTSLSPVGGAAPKASANRVEYAYPDVREWYTNGPVGLEQGFTVARAPARRTWRRADAGTGAVGQRACVAGAGRAQCHADSSRLALADLRRSERDRRKRTRAAQLALGARRSVADLGRSSRRALPDPHRPVHPAGRKADRHRGHRSRVPGLQRRAVLRRHDRDRRRTRRQRRHRRCMGLHAQRHDLEPAGKARRHGHERAVRGGIERRAGRQRKHRDRGWTRRQLRHGRRLGLHAQRHDMDPAGLKARRQRRRRRSRAGLQRGDLLRRQHGARRWERGRRGHRRHMGLHAHGIDVDPAGRKAGRHRH